MKGDKTMARTSKKKEEPTYNFDFANTCVIRGIIKMVIVDSEKVNRYSVDVPRETPNKKTAHSFITVVEFSEEDAIDEGTSVNIEGYISTGSYKKGKDTIWTTEVVATCIDEI